MLYNAVTSVLLQIAGHSLSPKVTALVVVGEGSQVEKCTLPGESCKVSLHLLWFYLVYNPRNLWNEYVCTYVEMNELGLYCKELWQRLGKKIQKRVVVWQQAKAKVNQFFLFLGFPTFLRGEIINKASPTLCRILSGFPRGLLHMQKV